MKISLLLFYIVTTIQLAPASVIGKDNRQKITNRQKQINLPFLGQLTIKSRDDKYLNYCTATAISPFHILTAAHCLHDLRDKLHVKPLNLNLFSFISNQGIFIRKNMFIKFEKVILQISLLIHQD